MISSNFNWGQDQADLLRRAARCAPLWGASGKTAFYERGLFTSISEAWGDATKIRKRSPRFTEPGIRKLLK